ncbi:hypothetical protein GCM10010401_12640 [Rarobacter faecitabidus]|uniref:Alternate signal-mediated exported protein n=1 Tax=Rarobacter faecitabidus TaxID=13243 RepID=A0A542Z8I2_RARFA|nr:alternate-type signal peptide domain-containing protein [Rarobacter faecitabidus]TQL56657.1 alternate signal-mediated exported protein [Rarobacter faecitabidus]
MNKITKGAIAGGIGVALLLGGAGTLAYWNDQAAIGSNATITAGTLTVQQAASPAPAWTVSNGTVTNAVVSNIASFRAVPGDVLRYTATYTITGTGDNLRATAGLGNGAIAAATPVTAQNTALADRLGASATVLINGSTTWTMPSPGTHTVTVTATITWPFAGDPTTEDNPAKTGAVTLSNFNLTVQQVQP